MVLALVLVIPTAWFPFQLGKVAIFSLLLVPVIILLAAGGGVREMLRAHGAKMALLVALLPVVYLLSGWMSINKPLSFIGGGVEVDTVLFVVLGFVAFILAFAFFRTLRTLRQLLTVLWWTIFAAAVFQFLVIVTGGAIIPFAGADASVNLIGKWNDLGLLVGLLLLMLTIDLELSALTPIRFMLSIGAAVVALIVLIFVNFTMVWSLILGFSIALTLIKFMSRRGERQQDAHAAMSLFGAGSMIPMYAIGLALISLTFVFFGAKFNEWATGVFPVSSIEVRPSAGSTYDIVTAAQAGSAKNLFFGTGPNTFTDAWLAYKPAEVNQSAFWSLDFNVGFSTLLTALGTVGFIGALVWLLPLFLVVGGAVRAVRLGVLSREERVVAITITFASIFLMAGVLFYVPSQSLVLLTLILAGAAFGFLWRQGQSQQEDYVPSRLGLLASGLLALLLIVVVVGSSFITGRRLIAQAHIQSGLQALSAQDGDKARASAAKSLGVETTGEALRLAIDASNLKLQILAQTEPAPQDVATVQQQFAGLVQEAVGYGQQALAFNNKDYRSQLALGRVYEFLASLNVEGAYESAKASYQASVSLNPTNPTIPLILARLESSKNNMALAQEQVTKSLTLKPNYTDAILFVVQLNVANNDIPKAIEAAIAAAQTAPGVAPIWFQLGLLYYASADTSKAIQALEQAVRIVPEYANAKYFLGLSYNAQKRTQDAILVFEDLARTNPDNAEIALILGNLRAGKAPFEGATPPVTPPEDRPVAPVSE
ncbi:MAG: tetratricopeptide repeat protein [Candidatus Pacebacteria bacterium]|nr:tetratricopeptide repeat protein [Candidatus Paceibacterota bacterium]